MRTTPVCVLLGGHTARIKTPQSAVLLAPMFPASVAERPWSLKDRLVFWLERKIERLASLRGIV